MRTHTSTCALRALTVSSIAPFPLWTTAEVSRTACLVESFLEAVRRNTSAATPPFGVHREAFAQAGLIIHTIQISALIQCRGDDRGGSGAGKWRVRCHPPRGVCDHAE